MNDFETHDIGTTREIQLSRELAKSIEQITKQYGGVVPESVMRAYNRLVEHYNWQQENGKA